ncbi:FMN-binding negative transcriptional regulator [Jatrophihabitans sp.]|uniref:FMN-binding negative transcriptional regulator n=1 Tax=Jatrophihabitans sp. TaxID=1932789 RepID=UPI0030C7184D|nr:transcriptional regulator protein [Jatrophihabitans sp.]
MLIHPWDAGSGEDEWMHFVRAQGFGQLIAAGRGRDLPVVVPTQFALVSPGEVVLHLARPNPLWAALAENSRALLSVAGDWAYIPAAWKAIGEEDPRLGVPTTYYAAVQLVVEATVVDDLAGKAEILRTQLGVTEPGSDIADPASQERVLSGIRGLRLAVTEVRPKFKYGGNVDDEHRAAVAAHLVARGGPGDAAARSHLERRTPLP